MTAWIMGLMQTHGPAMVFAGVIIESIIVPIPSPLILMGAGALIIEPGLSWATAFPPIVLKIVLPGAVASTLGAYFAYGIAWWGGKPLIERLSTFLGFAWDDVSAMERRLAGRSGPIIFLLRALPIVPLSLVSAAAGVLRLPVAGFSAWTLAGSVPRCFVLAYVGYFARDAYEGLAGSVNKIESLVSVAIVLGFFALVLGLRRRLRR